MYYNYKSRLYPTEEQIETMNNDLDIHRWTYNHFLEIINKDGLLPKDVLYSDLPILKEKIQEDKFGNKYDLKDVYARTLECTIDQLYYNISSLSGKKKKNKKNIEKGEYKRVRKIGKLRFKSKDRYNSFTYRQYGFEIIKDNNLDGIRKSGCPIPIYIETPKRLQILRLSNIGDIPIRMHRDIPKGYNIKQVIIKRYPSGEWYAIFGIQPKGEKKTWNERIEQLRNKSKEDKDEKEYLKKIDILKKLLEKKDPKDLKITGIDLGIINYLYDSDGDKIDHPKNIEKSKKRLKKEQQRLARKKLKKEEIIDKEGEKHINKISSKNRIKQKKKMAKVYKKIEDRRDDFVHKKSRKYVNENDIIGAEDLNIYNLMQISRNARNIADASWGKFIRNSEYKAESAGKLVIKVDPRNTSQRCSRCGKIVYKPLWIREHICPYCGLILDRDHNSSLEIKKMTIIEINKMIVEINKERVGKLLPEFTPLEI